MLVSSRKRSERIFIDGDKIKIMVVSQKDGDRNEALDARIAEFNKRFPVGTPVMFASPIAPNRTVRSQVKSVARATPGGEIVCDVEHRLGSIDIDLLSIDLVAWFPVRGAPDEA